MIYEAIAYRWNDELLSNKVFDINSNKQVIFYSDELIEFKTGIVETESEESVLLNGMKVLNIIFIREKIVAKVIIVNETKFNQLIEYFKSNIKYVALKTKSGIWSDYKLVYSTNTILDYEFYNENNNLKLITIEIKTAESL